MNDADIIVAGGGLNGTSLAIALASGGFRVALVDPQPEDVRASDTFDGRGYALSLSSARTLSAIGIWPHLAGNAQPIRHIRISDGRLGSSPSPLSLDFDQGEIDEGPMGQMIEDRHLRQALLSAIASTDEITDLSEVSVTAHETRQSGVSVTLSDGTTLNAALLVACDGGNSPTAKRAGIRRQGWDYPQSSLVCAIAHERPHEGTAYQHFLPGGPLAILPLTGDRSSIVWTERRGEARRVQSLDDEKYLDALRPRIGDVLGEISLTGQRAMFPLRLSLADALVADRVALVGDAAHVVHPIAGQGLNAGLKDVAALAEVLVDAHRRGEDIGSEQVLSRYQRWRRFDIASLAVATDGFNRLFSNDNPLLRLGRDLGLGLVSRLPDLRRGFIREAAGLTGDLPRLSRGQPL